MTSPLAAQPQPRIGRLYSLLLAGSTLAASGHLGAPMGSRGAMADLLTATLAAATYPTNTPAIVLHPR